MTIQNNSPPPLPFADLPEDVFWEILLHNATDPDIVLKVRALTTRSCSQVSRSWKESALRCSQIWAAIISYEYGRLTWVEELLKRSAPSPLTIQGDYGQPLVWTTHRGGESPILRESLLLSHKERWVHLSIEGLPEDETDQDMKLVGGYLLKPSPNIRSLKLVTLHWKAECYLLKGPLFAGHAPSLRSLELSDIDTDIGALRSIGAQLEELYLSWDEYVDSAEQQFLSKWVELLRATPQLRHLFIHHTSLRVESEDKIFLGKDGGTNLPKLESICLEVSHPVVCKAIMDALAIPDNCGFMVHCIYPPTPVGQTIAVQLIRARVQLWNQDLSLERALYAVYREPKSYSSFTNFEQPVSDSTFRSWAFEPIVSGRICSADPLIAFYLPAPSPEGHVQSFLSLLSAFKVTVPATTRLHLWIQCREPLEWSEQPMFISALSNFSRVTTLEISKWIYEKVFSAFKQAPAQPIIFPSLQAIRFLPNWRGRFGSEEKGINSIKEFLQWRINRGYPVATIYIGRSLGKPVVNTEVFRELSKMVNILQ